MLEGALVKLRTMINMAKVAFLKMKNVLTNKKYQLQGKSDC